MRRSPATSPSQRFRAGSNNSRRSWAYSSSAGDSGFKASRRRVNGFWIGPAGSCRTAPAWSRTRPAFVLNSPRSGGRIPHDGGERAVEVEGQQDVRSHETLEYGEITLRQNVSHAAQCDSIRCTDVASIRRVGDARPDLTASAQTQSTLLDFTYLQSTRITLTTVTKTTRPKALERAADGMMSAAGTRIDRKASAVRLAVRSTIALQPTGHGHRAERTHRRYRGDIR